jgi:very-short-patch-repair endonuclease
MSLDAKCWECGADIVKSFGVMDIMSGRFCLECYRKHTKQYKETVAEYLRLKNVVMFERAMRIMEKAYVNMSKYKRYANAVKKHSAEYPDLYKSSDEIVAAVIMLETGIDFEMNYKVGQYIADMYIPEWKLILEIDGAVHEGKELKDSNRDIKIRQMLGGDWEIIRIPTKYIEQDPTRIPDAIQALAKQKRKLRKENGGFLPNSYSKREAAHYKNAMVYETKRVPT